MYDELQPNDEVLFDRMVDGELSSAERRRLLATFEDRPDGWRRCALAFLEAQSWKHELCDLVNPSAARANVGWAASEPRSSRLVTRWYALAASVLVAFTLGLAFGGHSTAPPNPIDQLVSDVPAPAGPAGNELTPADALTLWVRDDSGQPRSLRVPLVDASTLDRRLGLEFPTGVPETVRDQLHERGYQVESKQRYAPLWLENGRPFVVPVEDTKIIPASNRVY